MTSETHRILHVSQPTTAGVMVVVRDLVRDQIQRGWDVTVACPAAGDLRPEIEKLGARWQKWEASRSPGPLVPGETRRLGAIVKSMRPDIVHLHSSKAGLAGRLAVRGRLPTVFEPNAWSFLAVSGLLRIASLRWEKFASRWTHATICVSDEEQRTAITAGISNPLKVIRNGINLADWPAPTAHEKLDARNRLKVASDARLVVSVGRLCRQKGQDLLLEAWPSVAESHPRSQLVLVGDGDDRAALEQRQAPNVVFAGLSRDVRNWYLAADLVVMPSRWEGLSLALLEAMATARCVVAFDVSGMNDAITTDCGLLVRPESVADLAAGLSMLLSDPDAVTSRAVAARQRVEQQFSMARTGEAVCRLYELLIGDGVRAS